MAGEAAFWTVYFKMPPTLAVQDEGHATAETGRTSGLLLRSCSLKALRSGYSAGLYSAAVIRPNITNMTSPPRNM